jgi:segregation and condensation protein A
LDVEPLEAAEELLARMIEARRYRAASEHLRGCLEAEEGIRYRAAPPPQWLRETELAAAEAVWKPARLGAALGGLLRHPPKVDVTHLGQVRVSVTERLRILRSLLARGRTTFDEAVKGADRVTVCITLFALLEMYKQGEATWDQSEPFGEIVIAPQAAGTAVAVSAEVAS